ncbi:MAG: DUF2270 domain-containing protein [Halanaeroarchaeum sp.]
MQSNEDEARGTGAFGRGLFAEDQGPGSALAHLYRGEVHRMKLWRERLDRTTNWAVIVLAAILTWAFSGPDHPHYILLVGMASLTIFLGIEARRYRGYDIWRSRVRTLQQNVFAVALDPDTDPVDPEWRRNLGADYRHPSVKITWGEAIAHRLRRIYLPLFSVILGAWVIRVTAFTDAPWPASAAVGQIPGVAITAVVVVAFAVLAFVAVRPRTWRARGELVTTTLRTEDEERRDQ